MAEAENAHSLARNRCRRATGPRPRIPYARSRGSGSCRVDPRDFTGEQVGLACMTLLVLVLALGKRSDTLLLPSRQRSPRLESRRADDLGRFGAREFGVRPTLAQAVLTFFGAWASEWLGVSDRSGGE